MIRTTITTVRTTAVTTNIAHFTVSAGALVLIPAKFSPLVTTPFQSKAITNPKAAARDVEIVFRTCAIVDFISSAMPGGRGWRLIK